MGRRRQGAGMSLSVAGGAAASLRSRTAAGTIPLAFVSLLMAMTLLVVVFPVPRTSDLINHWARLTLLTMPASDPLNALYRVQWGVIPNLGVDLLYLALSPLMSPAAVARLAFALSFVLPSLGAYALHRALVQTPSPTILIAPVMSYNAVTMVGLTGYGLGIGIGLFALAWRAAHPGRRARAFVVINLAAVALFFCHLIAFAAFCVVFGLMEASAGESEPWSAGLKRALISPVYVAAGLALVAFMRPMPSGFELVSYKAQMIAAPFDLRLAADLPFALGVVALVAMLIVERALAVARPARLAVAGFGALAVLAPPSHGATVLIDARLRVFWVYLALAAIHLRKDFAIVAPAAAALALIRLATLWPAWSDYDAKVADLREAFKSIPPGSRVLTVTPSGCGDYQLPLYYNLSTFATIDRRSAVNTLFSGRGMQPIRARDEKLEIAPQMAMSESWLTASYDGRPWTEAFARWRDHFDVVVDIHGACASDLHVPGLERVARSAIADVYSKK